MSAKLHRSPMGKPNSYPGLAPLPAFMCNDRYLGIPPALWLPVPEGVISMAYKGMKVPGGPPCRTKPRGTDCVSYIPLLLSSLSTCGLGFYLDFVYTTI